MASPEIPQAPLAEDELVSLAQRIVEVPDKLVTVQMFLEPLCNGDSDGLSPDARRALSDACSLLQSAIADVIELARDLRGLPALKGQCAPDGASPPP